MSSGLESDEGYEAFQKFLNSNGVYLTTEDVAEDYANSAVYTSEKMPNFPVVIKVSVNSYNLSPDFDDLNKDYIFDYTLP